MRRAPRDVPWLALVLTACGARGGSTPAAEASAVPAARPPAVGESEPSPPTGFRSVASAEHALCAVTAAGRLSCWGDAAGLGLLGDGDPTPHARLSPTYVGTETDWQTVEAGPYAFCAVASGGQRACWGHLRQPGVPGLTLPSGVVPAPLETPLRFAELTLGEYHACGLAADGQLSCWGDGTAGEAPLGGVPRGAALRAAAVALGTHHTCLSDLDGALFCLGSNLRGELARPRSVESSATLLRIGEASDHRALSCSGARCCALARDAALYCWGGDVATLFGVGGTPDGAAGPLRVALDDVPSSVAVLPDGVCAALPEGDALCWDDGGGGRPTRTAGVGRDAELVGGAGHRCALAGGTLRCWGKAPREGVIGRGRATLQAEFVALDGGWTTLSVTARGGCGTTQAGALRCWGRGDHLGRPPVLGEPTAALALPGTVEALSVAYAREGEAAHACAIAAGALYCWGRGESGQLGVPGLGASVPPVAVALAGEPAVSVSTGVGNTCALGARGSLWCWGDNRRGQLGQGNLGRGADVPLAVTQPSAQGWSAVSVAGARVSALRDDGSLWVWGDSRGGPSASTPTSLGSYGFASVLTTRTADTCALSQGGQLYCSVHDERGERMAQVLTSVSFASISSSEEGVCGVDVAGRGHCALPRRSHGAHGAHGASGHGHGVAWDAFPGYAGSPGLPLPSEPLSVLVGGSELRCALTALGVRLCAGVWRGDNFASDLDSETPTEVGAPR